MIGKLFTRSNVASLGIASLIPASYWLNKKGYLPKFMAFGFPGMITQLVSDLSFHFIDTINVRCKGDPSLKKLSDIIASLRRKAGIRGFFYGIGSTFFGSSLGGLAYFTLYKQFKTMFKQDKSVGKLKEFLIDSAAAALAEAIALLVFFPFETIKARMQMDNRIFPYRDVFDALYRMTHPSPDVKFKLTGLYDGCPPYFAQFIAYTTAQFACYETLMRIFRRWQKDQPDLYAPWKYVFLASTAGGAVASLLTNWLEVITIRKQVDSVTSVRDIIEQEGANIIFKGIGPRMIYNVSQSVMIFFILNEVCRLYKVKFEG